jgi:transposase
MLAPTLDAIPPLRSGRRGRPRHRPDKLHADKAYDAIPRRHECRARGIVPRIARRGIDSSERLGRHRWVVERTHAWFNRFRRLPVRYERRADIYDAFTSLAASLITLNQIRRFCYALLEDDADGPWMGSFCVYGRAYGGAVADRSAA